MSYCSIVGAEETLAVPGECSYRAWPTSRDMLFQECGLRDLLHLSDSVSKLLTPAIYRRRG